MDVEQERLLLLSIITESDTHLAQESGGLKEDQGKEGLRAAILLSRSVSFWRRSNELSYKCGDVYFSFKFYHFCSVYFEDLLLGAYLFDCDFFFFENWLLCHYKMSLFVLRDIPFSDLYFVWYYMPILAICVVTVHMAQLCQFFYF